MKSNNSNNKSGLDIADLLIHAACRFDKDVKFNPLDVDNYHKLTKYFEWCVTENIVNSDVETQINALKYFSAEIER